MPSESSLFFSRFNARSTGSPLRTITSGINNHSPRFRKYCKSMSGRVLGGALPVKSTQISSFNVDSV
jgi:hypothetical protein